MDTVPYTRTLEKERERLKEELSHIGVQDPHVPTTWNVCSPALDIMSADENEVADRMEEEHIDAIVLDELVARLHLVTHALDKVSAGTFGRCEICESMIEEDRLAANPAARTCKSDMGKETSLGIR